MKKRFFQNSHESYDLSVVFLWASVMAGLLMITGSIAWYTGKMWRTESYMMQKSIETCIAMHHKNDASQTEIKKDPFFEKCTVMVEKSHDTCIAETSNLGLRLRERKKSYMVCVMSALNP